MNLAGRIGFFYMNGMPNKPDPFVVTTVVIDEEEPQSSCWEIYFIRSRKKYNWPEITILNFLSDDNKSRW